MSEANERLAAWLRGHMTRRHLSQNKLARATGIGLTTVNRYCQGLDDHEPRLTIVQKLADYFQDAPPLALRVQPTALRGSPGLAEDGVEKLQPEMPQNGTITTWTVMDETLFSLGYREGDTVEADGALTPRDGDVVLCSLYSMEGTAARTALRIFKSPAYVMSAPKAVTETEIHEVGKTAAVFGVVIASARQRRP